MQPARAWEREGRRAAAKRAMDLILVVLAAPVVVPVLGVVAVIVRIVDGRPVLFRQTRCGRYGRYFTLLKLRSMRTGPGTDITRAGDPRVTRTGRVLRRTKLDELPQLWNVLVGDMSLVGPRPEVPTWVARHPAPFAVVHRMRPGLTDLASIRFRDEEHDLARLVDCGAATSTDDAYDRYVLPEKLRLGARYVERAGPGLDLAILAATVTTLATGRPPDRLLAEVSADESAHHGVPVAS
jgi:lipopolysaccharide/colanic/teichoic acid biosynthesis glycosyltransferase